MFEIAILTPSRGRPKQLDELIQALMDTSEGHCSLLVGLDEDDEMNYPRRFGVHYVIAPQMHLGPWTNKLAEITADKFPILASLGDDHRPRTKGWDTQIVEAMNDLKSGLVYTADGLQDEDLPTAPFWSSDIIKELGFYFPPDQLHLYADNFWLTFAAAIGRKRYLKDVLIEHLHWSNEKSEKDKNYEASDALGPQDKKAFADYMAGPFHETVGRVQKMLAEAG